LNTLEGETKLKEREEEKERGREREREEEGEECGGRGGRLFHEGGEEFAFVILETSFPNFEIFLFCPFFVELFFNDFIHQLLRYKS
jgi:hypothetical protein